MYSIFTRRCHGGRGGGGGGGDFGEGFNVGWDKCRPESSRAFV